MTVLTIGTRRALLGGPESAAARAARYGLVAAWNLDEASGARADSFGANNLTDNNTVTSAAGKVGLAGQFTAANSEFLSIADNAALSAGNFDFWISALVYLDTKAAQHCVLSKDGVAKEYFIRYNNSNDRFEAFILNAAGLNINVQANTFGSPSTATWYHLFVVHDAVGDLLRIAVNGGAFDQITTGGLVVNDSVTDFRIGARVTVGFENYMNGRIDAPAIGKPPTPISLLANEIRDYLWAGGAGRQWPWT